VYLTIQQLLIYYYPQNDFQRLSPGFLSLFIKKNRLELGSLNIETGERMRRKR